MSKYNTTNHDGRCTHGTTLGEYCDKCAAVDPYAAPDDVSECRHGFTDYHMCAQCCGELIYDYEDRIEKLESDLTRMKGINKENGDHAEALESQLDDETTTGTDVTDQHIIEAQQVEIEKLEDELKMFAQTPVGKIFQRNKELESQLAAVREFVNNEDGVCIQCLAVKTILDKAAIGEGE